MAAPSFEGSEVEGPGSSLTTAAALGHSERSEESLFFSPLVYPELGERSRRELGKDGKFPPF